jgi:ABC-2 type transport system ATP-binding protein
MRRCRRSRRACARRSCSRRRWHELDIVEKISTRVMILRSGEVVADDSGSNLRALMHLPSREDVFSQLAVKDDVDAVAAEMLKAVRL